MKKVLAIFALLVFTASFAQAETLTGKKWISDDKTGNFKLTVVCPPTLAGPTDIDLEAYFANTTTTFATPQVLNWTLSGPSVGTYIITLTESNPAINSVNPELTGAWNIAGSSAVVGDNTKTPSELGIEDCQTQVNINYTATVLQTKTGTGPFTFGRTVSVTVNL